VEAAPPDRDPRHRPAVAAARRFREHWTTLSGRPQVGRAPVRVLFVLVVLAHQHRRVLHFNVTEHPTAAWTAQQIVETFPDDSAPSYLLRDRDSVYGHAFRHRVKGMGIQEVLTAPHSPCRTPSRSGSLARSGLRRILTRYVTYYQRARTHLALQKDAPEGRPIERSEVGTVVQIREVGSLHHRYVRRVA
jgi:putative transposase